MPDPKTPAKKPAKKPVADALPVETPGEPPTLDALLEEADLTLAYRLLGAFAEKLRPTEKPTDLATLAGALAEPLPADAVDWKPQTLTRDKKKAMAVAYLKNRAIQDRLDAVAGPAGWRNEYRPGPNGGVVCGIALRIVQADGRAEWVTKWDGADNTQIEGTKGGLSDSMKRAAVQWGIGRYLYRIPAQWVPVDEHGRFAKRPELPPAFLPKREKAAPVRRDDDTRRRAEAAFHASGVEWVRLIPNLAKPSAEWDAQRPLLIDHIAEREGFETERGSTSELTTEQVRLATELVREMIDARRLPRKVYTQTTKPVEPVASEPVEPGPPDDVRLPGDAEEPVEDYPLTAEEREAIEDAGGDWTDADGWPR